MSDFAVSGSRRRRGPRGSDPRPAEQGPPAAAPVPFWDAVMAGAEAGWTLDRAGAREEAWRRALWDRHLLVRELTGEAPRPSRDMLEGGAGLPIIDGLMERAVDFLTGTPTAEDYERELEELLSRHRRDRMVGAIDHERPGIYRDWQARGGQLAPGAVPSRADLWREHQARLAGVSEARDEAFDGGPGAAAGAFAGGAGAFVVDPQYAAFGVGVGAATRGVPLLGRMMVQGLGGIGFEATQVPGRAEDAARFGGPAYTPAQAAFEVATAGAGGAGFELVGSLGAAGLRRMGWLAPDDPLARAVQAAAEDVELDRRIIGDQDGATFDAAREALDRGAPPPAVEPERDLGDLFGQEPGPPRPPAGAEVSGPVGAGQGGMAERVHHGRRILSGTFDPLTLEVDAQRFQYKADADAEGVTARLRGIERWDATSSGKVIVFETRDGRMIVADGHQRRGLARRLAEQGWEDAQLDGFLFREADGWTPREVRVVAALKNIREGSGTILDAAKVFRDAPGALNDRSLPVSGDFIHQARALARLSDEAFGAVVNKVIPERHGAAIGEMAAQRPDLHMDLVRLLKEGQPTSADEARALVSEGLLDDFLAREGEQGDLFGGLPRQSTTVARGQIRAAILRILRRDERAFANLVKNADVVEAGGNILARSENEKALALERAASEVISRLALRAGPVGEAFGEAAAAVATGRTTVAKAAQGLAQRVRNALKAGEDLDAVRAETIAPEPPPASEVEAVKAFDDPAGPAAARQAEPKPEDADLEAAPAAPAAVAAEPFDVGAPTPRAPLLSNRLTSLADHAPRFFRETSVEDLELFLPTGRASNDAMMRGDVYLADTPDLALGQGENRGVMMVFEPGGLRGVVSTRKPAWEAVWAAGSAEYVARYNHAGLWKGALLGVRMAKDAQARPATRERLHRALSALEAKGWAKVEGDGFTEWRRPPPPAEASPAAAAPEPHPEPGLFDDLADEAGGLERAIDVLKACAAGGRT